MKITFIILTKNEGKNIERCLGSIKDLADEIIVLDENSKDQTVEIAKKYGAVVLQNDNSRDFAQPRNLGMEKARNDWIFFVDADEEIKILTNTNQYYQILTNTNKNAFKIKRQDIIWGREIEHGENGRWNEIRLVKKDGGKWVGSVHEKFMAKDGSRTGQMTNIILNHYPHPTVAEFLEEINHYSDLRARELYGQRVRSGVWQMMVYPLGKFVFNYFFLLGFLDGTAGFISASMMSLYSFLVRAKLYLFYHRQITS